MMIISAHIASSNSTGRAALSVSVDGKYVGVLSIEGKGSAIEIAYRLGDDTPAAIRDRCYSLVQSMAEGRSKDGYDGPQERVDVYENEAYRIAKDAGWVK